MEKQTALKNVKPAKNALKKVKLSRQKRQNLQNLGFEQELLELIHQTWLAEKKNSVA